MPWRSLVQFCGSRRAFLPLLWVGVFLGSACTRCDGPELKRPEGRTKLAEDWERIARWYAKNGVRGFQLAPGATPQQLADAERELGMPLPEDVRASWALHNGGLTDSTWVLTSGDLLPLERIVSQWKRSCQWQRDEGYGLGERFAPRDIAGPIKPVYWSPKRLAVTDNSGDSLTIDLDPPADGVLGQVLDFDHELGPTVVVAKSWSSFLAKWADDLEAGRYVYFPHEGMVAPPGSY